MLVINSTLCKIDVQRPVEITVLYCRILELDIHAPFDSLCGFDDVALEHTVIDTISTILAVKKSHKSSVRNIYDSI